VEWRWETIWPCHDHPCHQPLNSFWRRGVKQEPSSHGQHCDMEAGWHSKQEGVSSIVKSATCRVACGVRSPGRTGNAVFQCTRIHATRPVSQDAGRHQSNASIRGRTLPQSAFPSTCMGSSTAITRSSRGACSPDGSPHSLVTSSTHRERSTTLVGVCSTPAKAARRCPRPDVGRPFFRRHRWRSGGARNSQWWRCRARDKAAGQQLRSSHGPRGRRAAAGPVAPPEQTDGAAIGARAT